jgi:hypothetical protein
MPLYVKPKEGGKPMRLSVIAIAVLGACTGPVGPGNAIFDPAGTAEYNSRRGEVEIIVKTQFEAILRDIDNGGGVTLAAAMDASGVPPGDRPTRILQLQSDRGLYQASPGALVTAIMVYGW